MTERSRINARHSQSQASLIRIEGDGYCISPPAQEQQDLSPQEKNRVFELKLPVAIECSCHMEDIVRRTEAHMTGTLFASKLHESFASSLGSDIDRCDSDNDSLTFADLILALQRFSTRVMNSMQAHSVVRLAQSYQGCEQITQDYSLAIQLFLESGSPSVQSAVLTALSKLAARADNVEFLFSHCSSLLDSVVSLVSDSLVSDIQITALAVIEQIVYYPKFIKIWKQKLESIIYPIIQAIITSKESTAVQKLSSLRVMRNLSQNPVFAVRVMQDVLSQLTSSQDSRKIKDLYLEVLQNSMQLSKQRISADGLKILIPVLTEIFAVGPCKTQFLSLQLLMCITEDDTGRVSVLANHHTVAFSILCIKYSKCRKVVALSCQLIKTFLNCKLIQEAKRFMECVCESMYFQEREFLSRSLARRGDRMNSLTWSKGRNELQLWHHFEDFMDHLKTHLEKQGFTFTEMNSPQMECSFNLIRSTGKDRLLLLTSVAECFINLCMWPIEYPGKTGGCLQDTDEIMTTSTIQIDVSKVSIHHTLFIWNKAGLQLMALLKDVTKRLLESAATQSIKQDKDATQSLKKGKDTIQATQQGHLLATTYGTEQTLPSATIQTLEQYPRSVTIQSLPSAPAAEETLPSATEQTLSLATEQTLSSVTEQTLPSVTEQTLPSATEQTLSSATEQALPSATEQILPSATEQTLSSATKDVTNQDRQPNIPGAVKTHCKNTNEKNLFTKSAPVKTSYKRPSGLNNKSHTLISGFYLEETRLARALVKFVFVMGVVATYSKKLSLSSYSDGKPSNQNVTVRFKEEFVDETSAERRGLENFLMKEDMFSLMIQLADMDDSDIKVMSFMVLRQFLQLVDTTETNSERSESTETEYDLQTELSACDSPVHINDNGTSQCPVSSDASFIQSPASSDASFIQSPVSSDASVCIKSGSEFNFEKKFLGITERLRSTSAEAGNMSKRVNKVFTLPSAKMFTPLTAYSEKKPILPRPASPQQNQRRPQRLSNHTDQNRNKLETRTPTPPSQSSPPDPDYNVFHMYSVEALIGSGKVALSGIFSCDLNVRKSSLFFLHDLVQRSENEVLVGLSELGCIPKCVDFLRINDDHELLVITGLTITRILISSDYKICQQFNSHGGSSLLMALLGKQTSEGLRLAVSSTLNTVVCVLRTAPSLDASSKEAKMAVDIWENIMQRWQGQDKMVKPL